MRTLINKFATHLSEVNHYTKDEEEQIAYSLRIVVFELIKVLGVILFFSVAGYTAEVLIAILVMTSSKPFIGGYHEDNQVKCFVSTLLIIGSIIYLGNNIHMDIVPKLILNLVALFCIWNQAPVVNPKMPINREELLKRNRAVGMAVLLVCAVISLIFYRYTKVSNTMVWIIVFQALLMFNKP
ncbi:accessory gene regulator ArgB-like protein [Clostridium thermarum]|uniref:accessory gene regulator ArgB-like protein n=1 Tax=Clostridium thermarum TaxID=1716543 RepID=UPI0013D138E7|nr:accessory gene regulator B family protein [Clostridium thermarum]